MNKHLRSKVNRLKAIGCFFVGKRCMFWTYNTWIQSRKKRSCLAGQVARNRSGVWSWFPVVSNVALSDRNRILAGECARLGCLESLRIRVITSNGSISLSGTRDDLLGSGVNHKILVQDSFSILEAKKTFKTWPRDIYKQAMFKGVRLALRAERSGKDHKNHSLAGIWHSRTHLYSSMHRDRRKSCEITEDTNLIAPEQEVSDMQLPAHQEIQFEFRMGQWSHHCRTDQVLSVQGTQCGSDPPHRDACESWRQ